MMIAPINSNKPKEIFKKIIDKIIEEENAITVKDLKIDGNDLINEFHLKPSPLIGKILNYLLDLILDEPELNNREFLLEKTRNFLESNNIRDEA